MLATREERREFLEARREGVGSSDIAVLFEPVRRNGRVVRDILDVYHDKTRPIEDEEVTNTHLIRGLFLEEPVAVLYEEFSGDDLDDIALQRHDEFDFAQAHTDRLVLPDEDRASGMRGEGAYEGKAPHARTFENLLEAGFPAHYIRQLQWEIACTGFDWGVLCAGSLESDRGPITYHRMPRHDTLIEQMLERARTFWKGHVEPRNPPTPDEWYDFTQVEVPETDGERVTLEGEEAKHHAYRLMRRYDLRQRAKEAYKEARAEFQEFLGGEDEAPEKVIVPGYGKVNWGWRDGRTRYKRTLERIEAARPLDPDRVLDFLSDRLEEPDEDVLRATVDEMMESCVLEMDRYRAEGDPYRHFRPYPEDEFEEPTNIQEEADA